MVLSLKELYLLSWSKYIFLLAFCIANVAVIDMHGDAARCSALSNFEEYSWDDSFQVLALSRSSQRLRQGHSMNSEAKWLTVGPFLLHRDSSERKSFFQTSLLGWHILSNPKHGLKDLPAQSHFCPSASLFWFYFFTDITPQ